VAQQNTIRLPGQTDRIALFGTTGSGKTVAAIWHLSFKDFRAMPWVIYNPSGDEHIEAIERAEFVGLDFIPQKQQGVYIANFTPSDTEKLNDNLGKIWERGNCGVYIDESYLSGHTENLFNILIAGRKRGIPSIYLAQAPVEKSGAPIRTITRNMEFVQIFRLPVRGDWDRVEEFIPPFEDERKKENGIALTRKKYHSLYYDRDLDKVSFLAPVPRVEMLIDKINAKLKKKVHRI